MVQTASTSEADQSHVPGATAVRVLGTLLILQGGYRLCVQTSAVVEWIARKGVYPSVFAADFGGLVLGGVLGLLTIVAGVLLVRLDRAGRVFGLVFCLVVCAIEVLTVGLAVVAVALKLTQTQSFDLFLHSLSLVLFLVGIILIARWHPPHKVKTEQLGRIFD